MPGIPPSPEGLIALALESDRHDPLKSLPDLFRRPLKPLYFDGNSLGLMATTVPAAVEKVLNEWASLAVLGWGDAEPPWFHRAEQVADRVGVLVGARPGEVAVSGTTTSQLHQLLATFFKPVPGRDAILIDEGAFPTDHYAVASHLALHGLSTTGHRVIVPTNPITRQVDWETLLQQLKPPVAVAVLPSVVYTTGERLPMAEIQHVAHREGILVIWDLSHSAGLYPHHLHDEAIDAAVFCTYKYLAGGPGSPAACFLHQQHWPVNPGLKGWWGSDKKRQFEMAPLFAGARHAGALQLGTPSMLALAPLDAVLDILLATGLEALWDRSERLVAFLRTSLEDALSDTELAQLTLVGPPPGTLAGGHLAVAHPQARLLAHLLRERGVVPDFRPPDILRLCPAPLSSRFQDIAEMIVILSDLLRGEGLAQEDTPRSDVT